MRRGRRGKWASKGRRSSVVGCASLQSDASRTANVNRVGGRMAHSLICLPSTPAARKPTLATASPLRASQEHSSLDQVHAESPNGGPALARYA